jgi:gliding motility-associated-like protein
VHIYDPGVFETYIWHDGSTNEEYVSNTESVIYVRVYDEYGCDGSDTTFLTVHPLPVVNLGADTILCEGNELELSAGDFAEYVWSTGEYTSQINITTNNILVGVMVTDDNGCIGYDTIFIDRCNTSELFRNISNVITPNNDGVNDTWVIGPIELFPQAKIEIFDRWGRKVYSIDGGYQNDWDGTWDGKELPMDSYHYIIDLKNGDEPMQGTITIVR